MFTCNFEGCGWPASKGKLFMDMQGNRNSEWGIDFTNCYHHMGGQTEYFTSETNPFAK